jgi:hypothetical protein
MSGKTITFGKYNGSTVNEVAIADPGYAGWAAQNMKSADWRKAFADALVAAKSATVEEIAAAHESPDSIHYGKVLEQVKADKAKEDRQRKEIDDCISRHARAVNVNPAKLSEIIKGFTSRDVFAHKLDPAKFSSEEKYQAVYDCLNEVYAIERRHFLEL